MNINSRNKRLNTLKCQLDNLVKEHKEIMDETQMFLNYPDILTGEQVQEILGIKRTTYYSLIDTEANKDATYIKIPVFRIGTKVKVLKRDLIQFVLDSRGGQNGNTEAE
ncbi:MAG: helix-turn-helix domain-containing protein [Clostridia bacterium]|nr:helix-turn-helix domain-containing protein [Clostridia bacterium]